MVKIKIVEDIHKNVDESFHTLDKLMKGEIKDFKPQGRILFMQPDVFAKVFSPARLRLILRIKRNKLDNIYQLAKELGRRYEAVYRDVKYLEGLGLIKVKTKDNKKIPYLEKIEIASISS